MTGIAYPGGGTASFVYNGDGRRIRKTEASVTRNYLHDGARVYGEHDANWTEVARFVTTGPSFGDGLVALRSGGNWYYPLYDGMGSVRNLINSSQTLTDTYRYDAFGNELSTSQPTYNPYKYVGALGYWSADSTTGLQHLSARYYNASVGRFTTTDPLHQGNNWYSYVTNTPTAAVDPSGLISPCSLFNIRWGRCADEGSGEGGGGGGGGAGGDEGGGGDGSPAASPPRGGPIACWLVDVSGGGVYYGGVFGGFACYQCLDTSTMKTFKKCTKYLCGCGGMYGGGSGELGGMLAENKGALTGWSTQVAAGAAVGRTSIITWRRLRPWLPIPWPSGVGGSGGIGPGGGIAGCLCYAWDMPISAL